jgi:transposase
MDIQEQIISLYNSGTPKKEIVKITDATIGKIDYILTKNRKLAPVRRRADKVNDQIESKVIDLYYNGLSHHEIAIKLNKTEHAIMGILSFLKKNGKIERRKIDLKKQGQNHNRAKITDEKARKIIFDRLAGHTLKKVAEMNEVKYDVVQKICSGKSWKYIFKEIHGEFNQNTEIIAKIDKTQNIKVIRSNEK